MAKKVVITETRFTLDSEKKHSVLYKAVSESNESNVIATSIYLSKDAFSGSGEYPKSVVLSLTAE